MELPSTSLNKSGAALRPIVKLLCVFKGSGHPGLSVMHCAVPWNTSPFLSDYVEAGGLCYGSWLVILLEVE